MLMLGLLTGVLLTILANTPGGALRQRRRQILVKEHRGAPRPRLGYAGHFFKFYCAVTLASVDSVTLTSALIVHCLSYTSLSLIRFGLPLLL